MRQTVEIKTKIKVLFRADGSGTIGAGHIMRCLALAQGLRERGHESSFLCADTSEKFLELIRTHGFSAVPINSQSGSLDDLHATITRAHEQGIDWVVVDSYAAQQSYMSKVRAAGVRLAVIDDIADREIDADIIINQALGAERISYKTCGSPRMLLGPAYAMLRQEYWNRPVTIHRNWPPQRILLSLGGAPPFMWLQKTFQAVVSVRPKNVELRVVMGALPVEQQRLLELDSRTLESDSSKITLLNWVPSLHGELQRADLFITASGSSVLEALALGTPLLVGFFAENQGIIYSELLRQGYAKGLGDLRKIDAREISAILLDAMKVPRYSLDSAAFDGNGVFRIVSALCA